MIEMAFDILPSDLERANQKLLNTPENEYLQQLRNLVNPVTHIAYYLKESCISLAQERNEQRNFMIGARFTFSLVDDSIPLGFENNLGPLEEKILPQINAPVDTHPMVKALYLQAQGEPALRPGALDELGAKLGSVLCDGIENAAVDIIEKRHEGDPDFFVMGAYATALLFALVLPEKEAADVSGF